MPIIGWQSSASVRVEVMHFNNHVSFYRCKAKDLAFLLKTLEEHKAKLDRHNFQQYSVYYKHIPRPKEFFGFSDSYPNWIVPKTEGG